MSLLRIPFILSVGLALNITLTPPNPPPNASERVSEYGRIAKPVPSTVRPAVVTVIRVSFYSSFNLAFADNSIFKAFYLIWTCFEVTVIVADAVPFLPFASTIISTFVRSDDPTSATSRIRVTPVFLAGCFSAISGAIIRVMCYRTLGELFTFELSIRRDHKLITSGPYSVVRHPSYTGIGLATLGFALCQMSGGSWLRECSGLSLNGIVGQILVAVWVVGSVLVGIVIIRRTKKEDEMLRKEFKDWDEWAKKVPYKLIPLIF